MGDLLRVWRACRDDELRLANRVRVWLANARQKIRPDPRADGRGDRAVRLDHTIRLNCVMSFR